MISKLSNGFSIELNGKTFLTHTTTNPTIFIGERDIDIEMDKGEFDIKDRTTFSPIKVLDVCEDKIVCKDFFIKFFIKQDNLHMQYHNLNKPIKLQIRASKDEKIYGLGEHFTSLNIRGHKVKNWVEEHITRKQIYNKIIRRLLKLPPKRWKFEEYKTYFIVPSFISSDNYFCYVDSDGYGTFDFTNDLYHEITFISDVREMVFSKNETILSTSAKLCQYKGITPPLPDWVYDGMILGVQGGTSVVDEQTKKLTKNGAKINGIWSQDWCGELFTYFGKQVLWNWKSNDDLYPNLQNKIKEWDKEDIKFLAYINPYLYEGESLYLEAKELNYLVLDEDKFPFLTQATSFKFGIVDLTNPKAYNWFKEIIKTNYIEFGIKGWMADFGEYLPAECVLHNGKGEDLHNLWPDLWIKLNREALEETNTLGNILFFNRAGYKDNVKYTTLIWNGDQHVDFTDDFGMRSALRAMLSLSMSGVGISHSDVGGYTTVPGIKRSKELFLRWLEMNTFNLVLRSHEGNKPWVNIQPYTDDETIQATTLFSNIHVLLKPYLLHIEKEYHDLGYPTIRPLFFYANKMSEDVYFLGQDLYVCPTMKKRAKKVSAFIPTQMVHLFTGEVYYEGTYQIETPIGLPAVFYNPNSKFLELFQSITKYIKKSK